MALEFHPPELPLTIERTARRGRLITHLDFCSEDEFAEGILLPLLQHLGFQRIEAAGSKNKVTDFWMRHMIPTQHFLYFGICARSGKIDLSDAAIANCVSVSEIFDDAVKILGEVIFDSEAGKEVLVDHAFIVASGEITRAARFWLGRRLNASKRSQIIFVDRADILNLFVVSGLSIPPRRMRKFDSSSGLLPL